MFNIKGSFVLLNSFSVKLSWLKLSTTSLLEVHWIRLVSTGPVPPVSDQDVPLVCIAGPSLCALQLPNSTIKWLFAFEVLHLLFYFVDAVIVGPLDELLNSSILAVGHVPSEYLVSPLVCHGARLCLEHSDVLWFCGQVSAVLHDLLRKQFCHFR